MKCPSVKKILNDLTFKSDFTIYKNAVKQWKAIGHVERPVVRGVCLIGFVLALPVIMTANVIAGTVVNVFAIAKNCCEMEGAKVLLGLAMLPLRPILTAVVIGGCALCMTLGPVAAIAMIVVGACRERLRG